MINMKIIGTGLYQWEVGRQLQIIPLRNSTVSSVHFSNPGDTEALVVKPKEENGMIVADIPNILLQSGANLVVYTVNVSESLVETLRDCVFSVRNRPKPADYVYTETEVLNYSYLDKRLKDLEGEGLANAVADYLEENPVQAGATTEEAAQIAQNKADIEKLNTDKLDAAKLPEAVNAALAQAKASGEFDGEPGKDGIDGKDGSPGEPGQPGADGKDGADGYTPVRGVDYYTEADKTEMVNAVLEAMPESEGGGLTTEEKNLIFYLFKNAAYTKPLGGAIEQLAELWGIQTAWQTVIPLEKILMGYGLMSSKLVINGEYKYASVRDNRASYLDFIPIKAGATYRFEWEGSAGSLICIEAYNTLAMENVNGLWGFSDNDRWSSGWNDNQTTGCQFTIPTEYNGLPVATMRFTFYSSAPPTSDITITEVVE